MYMYYTLQTFVLLFTQTTFKNTQNYTTYLNYLLKENSELILCIVAYFIFEQNLT